MVAKVEVSEIDLFSTTIAGLEVEKEKNEMTTEVAAHNYVRADRTFR